jgi:hypothetical protein
MDLKDEWSGRELARRLLMRELGPEMCALLGTDKASRHDVMLGLLRESLAVLAIIAKQARHDARARRLASVMAMRIMDQVPEASRAKE